MSGINSDAGTAGDDRDTEHTLLPQFVVGAQQALLEENQALKKQLRELSQEFSRELQEQKQRFLQEVTELQQLVSESVQHAKALGAVSQQLQEQTAAQEQELASLRQQLTVKTAENTALMQRLQRHQTVTQERLKTQILPQIQELRQALTTALLDTWSVKSKITGLRAILFWNWRPQAFKAIDNLIAGWRTHPTPENLKLLNAEIQKHIGSPQLNSERQAQLSQLATPLAKIVAQIDPVLPPIAAPDLEEEPAAAPTAVEVHYAPMFRQRIAGAPEPRVLVEQAPVQTLQQAGLR